MKVLVIGAGLGGLACAIACRRENLEVLLVERAPKILPIGAGIQVSANASRVGRRLGILSACLDRAMRPDQLEMRRYDNGKVLFIRTGREVVERFGSPWFVIHRADYHDIMLEEAKRLGVEVRLGCMVESLDFDKTQAILEGGERIQADVIVGADGLYSSTRDALLGHPSPPFETGDLAYRATVSKEEISALDDPIVSELCQRKQVSVWLGPDKHCVFYPFNGGKEYNLVLVRPDNLPTGSRTATGSTEEMRKSFEGWDPVLSKILSRVDSVLKWKLCHHEELEKWTNGCIALLGDSCHPTLPYQGQGSAMAVEDGATLGRMLGMLSNTPEFQGSPQDYVPEILKLYESVRKSRTTLNVQGAIENKIWYHQLDGSKQEARDIALAGGPDTTGWCWINRDYQNSVMGFDAVDDAEKAFRSWAQQKQTCVK